MKVLAYLAFTLLSILIQFSVMDLIRDKLELEGRKDLNLSSPKKKLSDILKEYSNKPHALFYRNNKLSEMKERSVPTNASESASIVSVTTTVYDILMYDENATSESTTTTELFSTTEVGPVENITELSIFGTKNVTTPKPNVKPIKKIKHEKCDCNLLHKVCDINCFCDDDCTEEQEKLFICPKEEKPLEQFYCSAHSEDHNIQSIISGLFCIAGSNLPEKRVSNYDQYKHGDVGKILDKSLKWQDEKKNAEPIVFTQKKYSFGDPVWLLQNGSISYIDVPSPMVNSYCHGRTPVQFLREDSRNCDVMIQDLEMLHVLKNIEETTVISVTDKFLNDSVLNCSSLHCTNWKILVCDETSCTEFNKTLHEPTCNDAECSRLAHQIKYVFHYHDGNITNATIYLHTQNYSPKMLIKQQVSIVFYLNENTTDDNVVKLSGNPGYLKGSPVIVTFEDGNYTDRFFNKSQRTLSCPENKNGVCVRSDTINKIVTFGTIAMNKCRYNHKELSRNATASCEHILGNVTRLLSLDRKAFVSPLGNPFGLLDKDWLNIEVPVSPIPVYGEYKKEATELFCSNVINKVDFVFGYANVGETPGEEKIKILASKAVTSSQNMTFNTEDISVVLTFETMFVDVTKKPIYEYAGRPNFNFHLPKDFFFPFNSIAYKPSPKSVLYLVILSYVSTLIPK